MQKMKEIVLANGKGIALVDAEDFPRVSGYAWHLQLSGKNKIPYAAAQPYDARTKKQNTVLLHRLILDAKPHEHIDHREPSATLDCRRSNLRIATRAQNGANRRLPARSRSGFKGVFWMGELIKDANKWRSSIKVSGKTLFLGRFSSAEEAARAYDAAAINHFGEFARINFPIQQEAA